MLYFTTVRLPRVIIRVRIQPSSGQHLRGGRDGRRDRPEPDRDRSHEIERGSGRRRNSPENQGSGK